MTSTRVDRAALVRRAMVELVAERGLHGASMSMVAERAGVATGTTYVHYESKEELLVAAFVEVKTLLGAEAMSGVERSDDTRRLFEQIWRNSYAYLRSDPAIATFLLQVEASPLRQIAHDALPDDDPLTSTAERLSADLVDLPVEIIYELSLAPAVRLVATDTSLSESELSAVIESCWRAVANR